MMDNQDGRLPDGTGLADAEASEPHARLGPSGGIPSAADFARLQRERDEAVQALADYRGQQYAPWSEPDPEDTVGAMIDNQAWVMMSHIGSIIGQREGDPDLMERWQEDWAENYPQLLNGWFSPHRSLAAYIARRLTLRPAQVCTTDHAAVGWAMCVGSARWEPFGDGRGEFCMNGLCHATKLDEFGVPMVTASMRAAIAKARGEQ